LKRLHSPSAHDVGELAGVSQAAVSRAFTPGASIAEATRKRVVAAAQKLGYRPNLLARSLTMGRSGIVGIVMGNPRNIAFNAALQVLSSRLSKAGKHMLIFTTEDSDRAADVQVEDLLKYRVDALLLMSADLSPKLASRCQDAGIPVFFFNRFGGKTGGIVSVTGDYRNGGRKIAQHLVEQGYHRLAYMAGLKNAPADRERATALSGYLAKQKLPAAQIVTGHYQREGAMAAARAVLSQPLPPDAIFCGTDYMAIATIEVARFEFGLKIGRELGVIGFGDIEQASWRSFDLTTYSQPVSIMVQKVVDLLLEDRPVAHPERIVVPGELKCRKSTQRD
jgi:DNA-binding LacI/PurR family transcriptional regulator